MDTLSLAVPISQSWFLFHTPHDLWPINSFPCYFQTNFPKSVKTYSLLENPCHYNCTFGSITPPHPLFFFFFFWFYLLNLLGFPDNWIGKESACNAGDPGSVPEWGRAFGEGIGYPLQYSWASLVSQLVKKEICLQCGRSGFDPWVERIP